MLFLCVLQNINTMGLGIAEVTEANNFRQTHPII